VNAEVLDELEELRGLARVLGAREIPRAVSISIFEGFTHFLEAVQS